MADEGSASDESGDDADQAVGAGTDSEASSIAKGDDD
jgi:hypothetical protein